METLTTTNLPVQFTATAIQEIKRLIAAESITPTLKMYVQSYLLQTYHSRMQFVHKR